MKNDLLQKIRRGFRKPPDVIARRVLQELLAESERFVAPVRARRIDQPRLLRELGFADVATCWRALAERPFASSLALSADRYRHICPTDEERIVRGAQLALEHRVDLMGSGPVSLGREIDWHKDYKSGCGWPPAYVRSIEYSNLERPSDVKFPWEVSRLQWLMPAGQAYALTGDERYAAGVRDVLDQWIASNPYAHSVNWTCTMEVALRVLTWSWFFHVFHDSAAWRDESFRVRFLRMLYLHGDFTARHLEKSDINGNHYTADAAGLVFAGLFFGERGRSAQWHALGWKILQDELPRQVFADGVDFEASVPYHRLVLELFLFPALYRAKLGLDVPAAYRERLQSMARFTATYSRPDGSVPLWGDADDARALPFGGQPINDHRYLLALVGIAFEDAELVRYFSGNCGEIFWWFGYTSAVEVTAKREAAVAAPVSTPFSEGGFYVMRNETDHVFIDCGPLGLAGRGGHGHNDALSFEAMLCGVHLITDMGAYLYTGDYRARNLYRSTASHNTPLIDGEEINRFVRPDYLWNLHDDAKPELLVWQPGPDVDTFKGRHSGYARLRSPVTPVRSIALDHVRHRLVCQDEFEGEGEHRFEVPLHLAEGVEVGIMDDRGYRLSSAGQVFYLRWDAAGDWSASLREIAISPSYGILTNSVRIVWQCQGIAKDVQLRVTIEPAKAVEHG